MSDPHVADRVNTALGGRYRIEREVGSGGMATVYVAHDACHDRRVALKVLKPEIAAVVGSERFLAEIRTTANLQHPHILGLHDSGEADGFLYFVMPFVEGETLRDRIDREKQLPVEEAVGLTQAIAAALGAAHEQGVIHRDIKPANILLSHGEPLVADFGIALAVQEAGGGRLTETGLSVGTPFYMSPEQATGDREADPRSDIYSLGTVLYEMLTGEPPFQGSTAQAVLGKILTAAPTPPSEVRTSVPPHVDAVIMKSLERLPADRFGSADEFRAALTNPAFRHVMAGPEASVESAEAERTVRKLRRTIRALAVISGVAIVALIALLASMTDRRGGASGDLGLVEFYVDGDDTHRIMSGPPGSVALSPDGRTIAYVGVTDDGTRHAFIRGLGDRQSRMVGGTEDAQQLFFSPDGAWLGFATVGNRLFKVRLAGGSRVPVAAVSGTLNNAVWTEDDRILFGVTGPEGLMAVPASGGAPVELLAQSDSLVGVIDPKVLPGGAVVIYTGLSTYAGTTVQAFRLSSGDIRVLGPGMSPTYARGHLVYGTDASTILTQPFDPRTLEFEGEPTQIASDVGGWLNLSRDVAVSPTGVLAYVEGGAGSGSSSLFTWDGTVFNQIRLGGTMRAPRSSPNGDRILYAEADEGLWHLYVYSVSQDTNRLLHSDLYVHGGSWSPDGTTVVLASGSQITDYDVYLLAADGTGETRMFRDLPTGQAPTVPEFSPDGEWLIWVERLDDVEGLLTSSILAQRLDEAEGDIVRVVADGAFNSQPTIGPEGRWIAYTSERTGRPEVYVTRFPDGGPGVPVSNDGGMSPAWTASGDTLLYFGGSRTIAVALSFDDGVRVDSRSERLLLGFPEINRLPRDYDLLPDGRLIAVGPATGGDRIVVRTSVLPPNPGSWRPPPGSGRAARRRSRGTAPAPITPIRRRYVARS